jgi:hypothetical protein
MGETGAGPRLVRVAAMEEMRLWNLAGDFAEDAQERLRRLGGIKGVQNLSKTNAWHKAFPLYALIDECPMLTTVNCRNIFKAHIMNLKF